MGSANGLAFGYNARCPSPDQPGSSRRPRKPFRTADDALTHMAESVDQLADYIDQNAAKLSPDEMARLQGVRGQNIARFARMLRDKARSTTGNNDPAESFLDRALLKAAETLGVDLSAA
jgi:hypothetical protein